MGNKSNKVVRGSRKRSTKNMTLRRIIQKNQALQKFCIPNPFAEHNYCNNSYNNGPIGREDDAFDFELTDNVETETADDDSTKGSDEEHEDQTDIPSISSVKVVGRRIVDIVLLFAQIKDLNRHEPALCGFSNMDIVNETRRGLRSIFHFQCKSCGITKKLTTTEESTESLDVNYALALASYAVGVGCYQSEEFLANLEIPFMSSSTYDKYQKALQKDLKECAKKEMEKAVVEEKEIATMKNNVDDSNLPLLTVIADGCWSKRSYGANFSSKSGTATLVGYESKKVIWNRVKNKYCKKCANNKLRGIEADHVCNTNFHGPPTGMESELLLEAFQESEKTYGVRYNNLVADGDSKTFSVITDAMIYMNPPLKVDKRECVIHLYRCGRSRLFKVKNLSSAKAKEIILGFQCARKHWAETTLPFHEKVARLRENFQYIPHHVFGSHETCDSYFCDKKKHQNDKNDIPEMRKSGQLKDITTALTRLTDNAKSLLHNQNTNLVEQFNSVVNKHTACKRLFLSAAGSWEGRVDASVIDFNTHRLGSTMLRHRKQLTESRLMEKWIYKLETRRIGLNLNRIVTHRYTKSSYSPDESYGTETCNQGDLDDETIKWRKAMYLADLKTWHNDRDNLERNTIGQSDCDLGMQVNSYTINAAMFGRIANARSDNGYKEIVQNILMDKRFDILAQVRHDQNHRKYAIQSLEFEKNIQIHPCGIFIDEKFEYMTASPDGLIGSDGIVVVSCPLAAENISVEEGVLNGCIKFWTVTRKPRKSNKTVDQQPPKLPKGRKAKLTEEQSTAGAVSSSESPFQKQILGFNKKNQFYYQIQGMLHITQRKYAVFVVWTSKNIKTETIEKDDSFWTKEIEPEITSFFENRFLPKIIRANR